MDKREIDREERERREREREEKREKRKEKRKQHAKQPTSAAADPASRCQRHHCGCNDVSEFLRRFIFKIS